jgi:sigma-54 dependent transcriptional regulator, acetoin dehydrogenase operon transcriptional activator AcoR
VVAAHSMPVSATQAASQRALARERLGFLTDDRFEATHVRPPILASWHRSRQARVAADEVTPLQAPDLVGDTPLHRAADPVLRGLATALDGQPVSVILTDRRGLVLRRLTADRALERRLDRVHLAPGFDYGEESVGTNGIGTALEVGGPAHVFGHEHFAERLEDLACAGVPIRHPVTGRTVGLVDLTCWQRNAGSLLMALAATTARQVQDELMQQSAVHERELLDEYLRTCRRNSGIVMAVSDTVTMLNDHSREVLSASSQEHLLRCASEALADPGRHSVSVDLPDGDRARMLIHHLGDGTHAPGVVVRVVPVTADRVARQRSSEHREAGSLPGLVGSGPVWQRACAEVEQRFLAGEWLAVTGPSGAGRCSIVSAVQLRG